MARPPASRPRELHNLSGFTATVLLIFAFIIFGGLPQLSARAQALPPAPAGDACFVDDANILSGDTRAAIESANRELYSKYGARLAVLTADTLQGDGYAQRVSYLRSVMDSWQLGGSGGRALLLAISVADMDYIVVAGEALKPEFSTEALKSLLDAQLEPDFQQGLYDSAIAKFISNAAEKADAYCSQHPELFSPGTAASAPAGSKSSLPIWALVILIAAGTLLALSVFLYLFSGRVGRSRYGYGSRRRVHSSDLIHRHNPVITPPRTNVLRHESRPTVHIKSTRQSTGTYRSQKTTYISHGRSNDWRQ